MFGLQDKLLATWRSARDAATRRWPVTRRGRKGRGEATMVWLIIAAAALALGAGLCASAEVALMRVSRSGAGELARSRKGNRNRAATRLQAVLAEPARYLAVLLLARVCSETAAIVLVAAALLHWLGTGWHVFLLIFVIMAAVLYVLAGIGPRILGRQHERTVALVAADVLYPVTRILGPLPRLLLALGSVLTAGRGSPGRVRHRGRAARPGRPAGTAPGDRARGAGHDPLGVRARATRSPAR